MTCVGCDFYKKTPHGMRCSKPADYACPLWTNFKPQPNGQAPTLPQMAAHFAKAMRKWSKEGFATVTKDEYTRRRQICNACSGGWRCPRCGCMLWAKAALKSESCEKWD